MNNNTTILLEQEKPSEVNDIPEDVILKRDALQYLKEKKYEKKMLLKKYMDFKTNLIDWQREKIIFIEKEIKILDFIIKQIKRKA